MKLTRYCSHSTSARGVVFLIVAFLLLAACRQETPAPTPLPGAPAATWAPSTQVTATPSQAPVTLPPRASATPQELTFLPVAPNGGTPPATSQPTVTPSPTGQVTPTPSATALLFPDYDGPTLDRVQVGVQVHLHREELDPILNHVSTLGAGWVKVQVAWKVYQPQPDAYDDWLQAQPAPRRQSL